MRLRCSPSQKQEFLGLINTLQGICNELLPILKLEDKKLNTSPDGREKKKELTDTYASKLISLMSFPSASFKKIRRRIPMRIPSVKICENSLKRLEEVKRLVENIEPVEDSDSALSNNIHQKVDQELIHRNSIHQKMNKELAHLKTLLGIAAVTITPQNVNTYTQIQAYADLEDETFVAILAEVEILLKKDMFRIDIYNPQYEDVYVSFINQIKNIAKMLLNQDNIQDSLSDDEAAEIGEDNDALDTAEEKNGVAINIIDIAELNELLENLKCLFEKASIQVTRYNRANVFGRIITVPYGNLQEILREIDMCLASELMQTNQDHRSCKKLYQLRERVQRKIKKNEGLTYRPASDEQDEEKSYPLPENLARSAKILADELHQKQVMREESQKEKERADVFYGLGFARRNEAILIYRQCLSAYGKRRADNKNFISNASGQGMYSHIVEENDRIYKEMRIMDDRIAEMEAELARMRELYEKNKNPGTQQQDAPETQQENPPKDNKKIPPGNKLKPGTGTIETDFSY